MSNTPIDVDALAQEIRRVDGNHDKGAGALAEALMPFLTAALQPEADTPPDIDQVATRIASKYLTLDISCERLYRDVVEALTAERAVASRKSAADTPAPQPPETQMVGNHERGIDAALSAHARAIEGGYQRTTKHMNEIIAAYLRFNPSPSPQPNVQVKPLDWKVKPGTSDIFAQTPVGTYGVGLVHLKMIATVRRIAADQWDDCVIARGGLEEVKLAAFRHYEDTILSAIKLPPQPNLRVIADACEGIDDDYMTSETHHPGWVLIPQTKFDAIRAALAATATEDGQP